MYGVWIKLAKDCLAMIADEYSRFVTLQSKIHFLQLDYLWLINTTLKIFYKYYGAYICFEIWQWVLESFLMNTNINKIQIMETPILREKSILIL
jgi:hypothetical protein